MPNRVICVPLCAWSDSRATSGSAESSALSVCIIMRRPAYSLKVQVNSLVIRQGLRVLCQISRPVDIQTGPLPLPCRYLVQAGTFPQVAEPTLALRPDVVKGAGRRLLRGVVTHPGVSQIAGRERPRGAPAMRDTARRSSNSGRVLCSCRQEGQEVRRQGGVTLPYCKLTVSGNVSTLRLRAVGKSPRFYSRGMIA
jgi:hypothetical protein